MQETGFLSWRVNIKEINANAAEYSALTLDEQKAFLIECLDKNLLYVPYGELENEEFGISKSDQDTNRSFYGIE
jgi:adenine-specific DNA-methyltransferase